MNKNRLISGGFGRQSLFFGLFLLLAFGLFAQTEPDNTLSLAGNWRVALDPYNTGMTAKWPENGLPGRADLRLHEKLFFRGNIGEQPEEMHLPGTDSDGHLGQKLTYTPGLAPGLERLYAYDGVLWFEKEIDIPENWRDKSVQLFLERVPGNSKVWLDGKLKNDRTAWATPHVHELMNPAAQGRHRITVRVDNNVKMETDWSHHVTPGSGARWNGLVGRIELQAVHRTAIKNMQVHPNIREKKITVQVTLANAEKEPRTGNLSLTVRKKGASGAVATKTVTCELSDTLLYTEIEMPVPDPVRWDEFNPFLYELEAELTVSGKGSDTTKTLFGVRELTTEGSRFLLNGQPLFLRGTLDCGQFPLRADPAMDRETWMHVLQVYRQYGLNHVRFHTWCPPEAAFQAADELGMIFQIEMASPPYPELSDILDTYGNHPSFGLLSLHNERSHTDFTRQVIGEGKKHDARHLYCCTSHPWQPDCTDDFFVSAWGVDRKRTVGIQWAGGDVISVTRFNTDAPETSSDYRDAIRGIDAPVISHEMGQWAVYPDISELPEYNGALRNLNCERITDNLREKGLLDRAPDFVQASGQLALLLYKEEIEATLRTPLYGGFQLLDLHDFQGQGLSTVGIINAFWKSKGLITPEGFREFCSPSVPLFRMEKRVWTRSERFEGVAELSYFGPEVKKPLQARWRICNDRGEVLSSGKLGSVRLEERGLIPLGKLSAALNGLPAPAKLQLVIELPEINAANRWDFWLYPDRAETAVPPDIQVFTGWGSDVEKALENGQKVLLFPKAGDLPGSRAGCFTTMFWNPLHKWHQKPHTMGILCNPEHPVFTAFPTEAHSNWQWWDLTVHARAMVLDHTPVRMKPLVQVIDNFVTNQRLGYLYECKVGAGKLMVCSMDIDSDLENRPVARQFRQSVLLYMASDKFDPTEEVDMTLPKGR
ncbi:MAG: hypothetical protein LBJ01_11145 [Tannerella sp.]|jgi:hypothetical protein|nr:hypothetical protein [Tannerella sp.]